MAGAAGPIGSAPSLEDPNFRGLDLNPRSRTSSSGSWSIWTAS